MKTITYLQDILPMKKVLAIFFMLLGIAIFLFNNIFIGIFLTLIGINMIGTEGSEINLENKTYRTIKSVFGLKFGKWKPCPEFEYISVFKTNEKTNINIYAATVGTFKTDIILLNLFYKGNKHITFYKTDDKADAFKVAEHFKLALDIDILDATGEENKWL